ncbi:MAG: metallophosphoesterase [Clostridia bacterium]|nr:metallophosphoesterase [Clostridia bacterium]
MKFTDKKFKFLILSDIHTPHNMPIWTESFISYAMESEKPDLVVLLGDNTAGYYKGVTKQNNITAIKKIVSLLGDTSFAVVFGNHDHEGLPTMSESEAKSFLFSVYSESKNCLMGQGDYSLNIKDSKGEKDIFSFYFVDSGTYHKEGGYAFVGPAQLQWYKKECEKNGNLPSYLFQHIIVPEVYDLMHESRVPQKGYTRGQCIRNKRFYKFKEECLISGAMHEGPCPPDINGGQLEVMKEKNCTVACFFGHDHTNDFVSDCKSIKLIAVPSPSFYTYGNNRGIRVVTIHEDDLTRLDTRLIYYNDVMKDKPKSPLVNKWGISKYERIVRRKAR